MKKFFKILLLFVVISTVLGAFIVIFSPKTEQSAEQSASERMAEKANTKDDSIKTLKAGAYLTAKKLIEADLKAPSTAKFSNYGYGDNPATVDWYEDGTFVVTIWVDAQNSFGAMLRNKYQVVLTVSNDNWKLKSINKLN